MTYNVVDLAIAKGITDEEMYIVLEELDLEIDYDKGTVYIPDHITV